jgi:hypothetical protein
MDGCCSPVEKGWAWAASALRRQGEKEIVRERAERKGSVTVEGVCRCGGLRARVWLPHWREEGSATPQPPP